MSQTIPSGHSHLVPLVPSSGVSSSGSSGTWGGSGSPVVTANAVAAPIIAHVNAPAAQPQPSVSVQLGPPQPNISVQLGPPQPNVSVNLGAPAPPPAVPAPGQFSIGLSSGTLFNATVFEDNAQATRIQAIMANTAALVKQHVQTNNPLTDAQIQHLEIEEINYTRQTAIWTCGDGMKHHISFKNDVGQVHAHMNAMVREMCVNKQNPVGFSGLHEYNAGYMGSLYHPNGFKQLDDKSRAKVGAHATFDAFVSNDLQKAWPNISRNDAVAVMQDLSTAAVYRHKMMAALRDQITRKQEELTTPRAPLSPAEERDMKHDLRKLRSLYGQFENADLFALNCLLTYVRQDGNRARKTSAQRADYIADRTEQHLLQICEVGDDKNSRFNPWKDLKLNKTHKDYAARIASMDISSDADYDEFCRARHMTLNTNTGIEGVFIRNMVSDIGHERRGTGPRPLRGAEIFDGFHDATLRGTFEAAMNQAKADIQTMHRNMDGFAPAGTADEAIALCKTEVQRNLT